MHKMETQMARQFMNQMAGWMTNGRQALPRQSSTPPALEWMHRVVGGVSIGVPRHFISYCIVLSSRLSWRVFHIMRLGMKIHSIPPRSESHQVYLPCLGWSVGSVWFSPLVIYHSFRPVQRRLCMPTSDPGLICRSIRGWD